MTIGVVFAFLALSSGFLGTGSLARAENQARTDVNARDARGLTPLEAAVNQGDINSVLTLIQAGADVNARERSGRTAISWAGLQGRLEIVRALARAGADLNVKDQQGWTPLTLAFSAGHFAVVWSLVEAGADVNRDQLRKDVNTRDASGKTPLERAKGDVRDLRALIQLGADVNAADQSGRSLLFAGRLDLVRVLLEAGVNVNVKDERG